MIKSTSEQSVLFGGDPSLLESHSESDLDLESNNILRANSIAIDLKSAALVA